MFITGAVALTRIFTDTSAPSSFKTWLNYVGTNHVGILGFLLVDSFFFTGVALLTAVQASQIAHNITTNEMTNSMRYSYLRDPAGRFRNPYDHGIRKNCTDLLITGYNEDIEVNADSKDYHDGIGMTHMSSFQLNGNGHSHPYNRDNNNHTVDLGSSSSSKSDHGRFCPAHGNHG